MTLWGLLAAIQMNIGTHSISLLTSAGPSGEIIPLLIGGYSPGVGLLDWSNNFAALDDISNNRPLKWSNTPYSLGYYGGLAKSSVIGAAAPAVFELAPVWMSTSAAAVFTGLGVYYGVTGAKSQYANGNYFQAGSGLETGGLARMLALEWCPPEHGCRTAHPNSHQSR